MGNHLHQGELQLFFHLYAKKYSNYYKITVTYKNYFKIYKEKIKSFHAYRKPNYAFIFL
jgi:hypothetical protein